MNEILALIIAAIIQGILEWLPVSSEAFLILVFIAFGVPPLEALMLSIIFHAPTAFASMIYFRGEYLQVLRDVTKGTITYRMRLILLTTLVSGAIAVPLYFALKTLFIISEEHLESSSMIVMTIIGAFMILAGSVLKVQRNIGMRTLNELGNKDSVFVGLIQGFAILPGVTRSGVTLAAFLYRKFDRVDGLKGTFILAGPISLLAFIFLVLVEGTIQPILTPGLVLAVIVCFAVSMIAINFLIRLAERLNYARFLKIFGSLMLVLSILSLLINNYYYTIGE